jgi:hypothetical protein
MAVCDNEHIDEVADIMEKAFKNNPYFVKVYKTKTSNTGVQIIG